MYNIVQFYTIQCYKGCKRGTLGIMGKQKNST